MSARTPSMWSTVSRKSGSAGASADLSITTAGPTSRCARDGATSSLPAVTQWIGASKWVPTCSPDSNPFHAQAGPRSSLSVMTCRVSPGPLANSSRELQDRRVLAQRLGEVERPRQRDQHLGERRGLGSLKELTRAIPRKKSGVIFASTMDGCRRADSSQKHFSTGPRSSSLDRHAARARGGRQRREVGVREVTSSTGWPCGRK